MRPLRAGAAGQGPACARLLRNRPPSFRQGRVPAAGCGAAIQGARAVRIPPRGWGSDAPPTAGSLPGPGKPAGLRGKLPSFSRGGFHPPPAGPDPAGRASAHRSGLAPLPGRQRMQGAIPDRARGGRCAGGAVPPIAACPMAGYAVASGRQHRMNASPEVAAERRCHDQAARHSCRAGGGRRSFATRHGRCWSAPGCRRAERHGEVCGPGRGGPAARGAEAPPAGCGGGDGCGVPGACRPASGRCWPPRVRHGAGGPAFVKPAAG